jgi:hypothetical protein
MADLKISQLTELTTANTVDILPIVNSNETKKISLNSLNNSLPITTFVQNTSGTWGTAGGDLPYIVVSHQPPYSGPADNLPNSTDTYLAWDAVTTNDSNIFELVNSGTADARVQIKQTGRYEVRAQAVYFDLWNNVRFSGHLDVNTSSTGGSWSRVLTLFQYIFGSSASSPPGQIITGQAQINVTTANEYYSVALNPSANTPFPVSLNNTVTNLFIRKIGA